MAITTVPTRIGRRTSNPIEYFRVGHVALGNADGLLPNIRVAHPLQLHYPLADGLTRFAYDLAAGVTIDVDELLAGAIAAAGPVMPWDRNPLAVYGGFLSQLSVSNGHTLGSQYTVPAGRKLFLSSARAMAYHAVQSSFQYVYCQIYAHNTLAAYVHMGGGPVGTKLSDEMQGGPVILTAGQVVTTYFASSQTGGNLLAQAWWNGFLFDA